MKFALMTFENEESKRHIREHRDDHRSRIAAWMAETARSGKLVGGEAFETEKTAAVTVRHNADGVVTVLEGAATGGETVGGYLLVDVADRAEAVELAKSWPTPETIEIRPIWQGDDDRSV